MSDDAAFTLGRVQGRLDCADEVERLRGTLRYIAAQAKARHPGALEVIRANAEAALDGGLPSEKLREILSPSQHGGQS